MKFLNGNHYIFFLFFLLATSCNSITGNKAYENSDMYDFATPHIIDLPVELDEISGIAYYPKDTSVFAIIDEDGLLYKINIMRPMNFSVWQFDKKRDYEDIVLLDSTFYLLTSDGDIVVVNFMGDSIASFKTSFKDFSTQTNEFESMYNNFDDSTMMIICKDCDDEDESVIKSFSFRYVDQAYSYQPSTNFDVSEIGKIENKKTHFRASAAAINPVTSEVYIISAIVKKLAVFTKDGLLKKFYTLDPGLYKQPEGIAFTPEGDLIISNEFADEGKANLLIMKNKLKGK